MNQKTYLTITTLIFFIIALLHLTRAIMGWEVSAGGWIVPLWVSWILFAAPGFLAYSGFNIIKRE